MQHYLVRILLAATFMLCLCVTHTASADGSAGVHEYGLWYMRDPKPTTLSEALAVEKVFLGNDNSGYRMPANAETCSLFKKVGLPCDYNTRCTVSMFLTVNGKGLFPAKGKTNPYVFDDKGEVWPSSHNEPDDVYIGTATQGKILIDAVRRNAALFKNGDLTAEDVRTKWR